MEDIFNDLTSALMMILIVIGALALPITLGRVVWELVFRRVKPLGWYFKVWVLPFGFFVIAGAVFVLRSLSPVFWGKPTGGLFTVETTYKENDQIVQSEKRTADVQINVPKPAAEQTAK